MVVKFFFMADFGCIGEGADLMSGVISALGLEVGEIFGVECSVLLDPTFNGVSLGSDSIPDVLKIESGAAS